MFDTIFLCGVVVAASVQAYNTVDNRRLLVEDLEYTHAASIPNDASLRGRL